MSKGSAAKSPRANSVSARFASGARRGTRMEVGEDAAEDGARRELGHQVADRRLDLRDVAPEVGERVALQLVDRDRHLRLRALADGERPRDELLSLRERPLCERQHRPSRVRLPELDGLPELLGHAVDGTKIGVGLVDLAEQQLRGDAMPSPLDDAVRVADPLADLAELTA